MQPAMERMKQDLGGALRNVHADLERVEILAAALYGFSAPIPDYEPTFRHLSMDAVESLPNRRRHARNVSARAAALGLKIEPKSSRQKCVISGSQDV